MRRNGINITPVIILALLALLAGGCDRAASPSSDNSRVTQPPPPIQATPFHGQVYKSLNGRTVLTLISKDECELAGGGTTLLCKYTKADDKLRVVVTALGTSQVKYYRFTAQGLEDNDGNVLLSPESLAATIKQIEQERLAEERERERKMEAQRQEAARLSAAIAASKIETLTNYTFSLPPKYFTAYKDTEKAFPVGGGPFTRTFTITDVSIKLYFENRTQNPPQILDTAIYFADMEKDNLIRRWETYSQRDWGYNNVVYTVALGEGAGETGQAFSRKVDVTVLSINSDDKKVYSGFKNLLFTSPTEATTVQEAISKAYYAWAAKYPQAAK